MQQRTESSCFPQKKTRPDSANEALVGCGDRENPTVNFALKFVLLRQCHLWTPVRSCTGNQAAKTGRMLLAVPTTSKPVQEQPGALAASREFSTVLSLIKLEGWGLGLLGLGLWQLMTRAPWMGLDSHESLGAGREEVTSEQ